MPDLVNKQQLATAAKAIARSFELVQKGSTTFIPVHWDSLSPAPTPPREETIWLPLTQNDKKALGAEVSGILFSSDGELRSFEFMLGQLAANVPAETGVLIKTEHGLRTLNEDGKLVKPTGGFVPNYIRPMLNEDPDAKREVFETIREWLGGDAEVAHSLLHHLATVLAPHYSPVKYVLLLGEGRNGKSVLLFMLTDLLGVENYSKVTRQMIAERSPVAAELNDKLLNVVFDGEMGYIKDSSMEKTLIAGEPGVIRRLYESGTTTVQTNALFIEGLQLEPKVRDKSPALQKRLARFRFPKVYAQDKKFAKHMRSPEMLGAFLSVLIDHYVHEDELAEKLALTAASLELQLEQVFIGSPVLQFLEHLAGTDQSALDKLNSGSMTTETFLASFKPWAQAQNLAERSDSDLLSMMKTSFDLGWKTIRGADKKPASKRVIKAIRPETLMALEQLKGSEENGSNEPDDEGTGESDLAEVGE